MLNNVNKVKIIFHIDLNAFFCSVAQIYYPHIKGKAFAIGRENSTKGVIATASYEARKYGVNSAMPLIEAFRLCPKLIVIASDREAYKEYHIKFVNLIKGYSSLVEVASIDEVYADMTLMCEKIHPLELAKEIQTRLLEEYMLPCSIGIAPTLFLAKMACELKKPLGISVLRKREIKDILYPQSVKNIFGIGRQTYPKLIENNILTIGDFLKQENMENVINIIGEKRYFETFKYLNGDSSNIVDPNRNAQSKSISTCITYDVPKINEEDILFELVKQMKDLHRKLMFEKLYAKTISITLRDMSFKTISRSKSIEYTNNLEDITDVIYELVADNVISGNIEYRLLGCGISNFKTEKEMKEEYNLFTYEAYLYKDERIDDIIDSFTKKYGKDFIKKGF